MHLVSAAATSWITALRLPRLLRRWGKVRWWWAAWVAAGRHHHWRASKWRLLREAGAAWEGLHRRARYIRHRRHSWLVDRVWHLRRVAVRTSWRAHPASWGSRRAGWAIAHLPAWRAVVHARRAAKLLRWEAARARAIW